MRCEEIQERLAAYVDGELSADETEAVSVHLETCLACQADHAGLKVTRERVASLPRVKAPANLAAAVAARIAAPQHAGEKLSALLDGELPEAEKETVQEHLASCEECARALAALGGFSERVRTLPRESAPPSLVPRVLERLFAPRRRPASEPIQISPHLKRFLAAASFLVLALGSIAFSTPNVSSDPTPGVEEAFYRGTAPPSPPPRVLKEERKASDPERTITLSSPSPETAAAALELLAQASGFQAALVEKNRYCLTGTPETLRTLLVAKDDFTIDDPARFAELVPPPLDRLYLRSSEVLVGTVQREDRERILFASNVAPTGLPDPATLGPGTGLTAEWFLMDGTPADIDVGFRGLTGRAPAVARIEPTVDFATPGYIDKARPFPTARSENVAARFRGYFAAERTGTYTFGLGSDDGGRLEIDHRVAGGQDGNHGYSEPQVAVTLVRGLHAIAILYFNGGGPGACRLLVAEPGGAYGVAPQRLLHDADRIEHGRHAVPLAVPRRSVVKVQRASREPVTLHVLLRARSD